jgi:hypothetical protein
MPSQFPAAARILLTVRSRKGLRFRRLNFRDLAKVSPNRPLFAENGRSLDHGHRISSRPVRCPDLIFSSIALRVVTSDRPPSNTGLQGLDTHITEAGLAHPVHAIRARAVEAGRRFDQHVQAHEQVEGILAPLVIDHRIVDDQRASAREGVASLPEEELHTPEFALTREQQQL